jgi:hypothetical protein
MARKTYLQPEFDPRTLQSVANNCVHYVIQAVDCVYRGKDIKMVHFQPKWDDPLAILESSAEDNSLV